MVDSDHVVGACWRYGNEASAVSPLPLTPERPNEQVHVSADELLPQAWFLRPQGCLPIHLQQCKEKIDSGKKP